MAHDQQHEHEHAAEDGPAGEHGHAAELGSPGGEHDHSEHVHTLAQVVAPEPVDGDFAPRPAPAVLATELDGELVLLDPRTDRLHLLDQLATLIWNVFDGEVTVDELTADLADAFETPAATVRDDLDGLVRSLRAAVLLDGVEPPAHQLVGAESAAPTESAEPDEAKDEGLWRPDYLVNPPAP